MRFARFALLPAFILAAFSSIAQASAPLVIMSMGDSITIGVDYLTSVSGGYRDPLYQDLNGMGIAFTFVGANTGNPTNALTAAGQTHHNGYGSWHIQDLDNNLDGSVAPLYGGDANLGGYFLTGGHGTGRPAVSPDILLLHVGTNDLLQGTANIDQNLYSLVTHVHALSPNTIILIAGVIPINNSGFTPIVQAYNSYIKNTLVPALPYTFYVDQNTPFLNSDGSINGDLLGADLVHPDRYGYPLLAYNWAMAIKQVVGANGTTYGLTVTGGNGTGNYAPGSVLTIRANPPAGGSQFGAWTPGTTALANPFTALNTYTMPAAQSALSVSYAAAGSPLIPDGTYQINSFYDSLSIAAAGTGDGSAAQQQTYTGTATQKWQVTNLGNNVITLMLTGTREALEVPAANAGNTQAYLDVATYNGAASQQWTVTPINGAIQLVNAASGQAVTINGYATYSGAPLVQYTGTLNIQMWRFYPLSSAPATYNLTVNNGSGGGYYTSGSNVTVVANTPTSGQTFAGWTGSTSALANPSAATTTLTMPSAAASITASFITMALVPAPSPAPSPAPTPTPTPTPSAASPVVSVQFPQYYNHKVVTPMNGNNYTGGVVPLQNWNVADTDTGTNPATASSGALIDSTGAASAVGFTYSGYTINDGTNNYSFPQPIWYQTGGLTDDYIAFGASFNTTGAAETLVVSGLNPNHTYKLIVYVAAPWWANGGVEPASVSVGSTSYAVQTSNKLSTWVQATSTIAGAPTTGNYVLFTNLSGAATQTVTLRGAYVGLGGFQLIDTGSIQ